MTRKLVLKFTTNILKTENLVRKINTLRRTNEYSKREKNGFPLKEMIMFDLLVDIHFFQQKNCNET